MIFGRRKPNVQEMERKQDIKGLIKALECGVEDDPSGAGKALGRIGEPAVEPLIRALDDESGFRSHSIIKILGSIGDPRAVPALSLALGDPDAWIRDTVVKALGELGKPAAEPLIRALDDNDLNVRQFAIIALGTIGDSRAVEPLVQVLNDENTLIRRSAAEALGAIGDERAVEPLVCMLDDPWFHARKPAAEALDKLGWTPDSDELRAIYWIAKGEWVKCVDLGQPAVLPLIRALSNEYPYVRDPAAEALAEIGDLRAVEPLIQVLEYHLLMPSATCRALIKIGEPAVEPLIRMLDGKERLPVIIQALGGIGDPRAVEPLIQVLGDEVDDVRIEASISLGEIGDPRAVEPLIRMLGDPANVARSNAAEALGKIGDPRAVEPLIQVLGDSFSCARSDAAEALDKLGWTPDSDELRAIYWIAKGEWVKCVDLGQPAVLPLIRMLGDNYVGLAALTTLGRIGDPGAAEPATRALRYLDKVVELNPIYSEAWLSVGYALHWLECYEEALQWLDKGLELDPKNAVAWKNKGRTLIRLNRGQEALLCWDKVLEINPRDDSVLYWRKQLLSIL